MMELRPIIIDNDNMILGGNMRLRALKELGYKDIPSGWVKRADELTEDEKRRFVIADNVGFGEWDFDMLANEWDSMELQEWGLEVPVALSFEDKNQEIDTDGFSDMMTLKIELSENDYKEATDQLKAISTNLGDALMNILRGNVLL